MKFKYSLKSQIFHSKIESEISDKSVTFQGIFELETHLEEKILTSHTCLRYSKDPPGSHNSSAHRIMCIRRVERNIFRFGATPPQKGPFHTSWLKRNNSNRTFYAELANMDSYKFHHAKENQISHISSRGATSGDISSFQSDAVKFS